MRTVLFSLLLLGVTACGFEPLYGTTGSAGITPELEQISISEMSGPPKASRWLLGEMRRVLPPADGLAARYDLKITSRERRTAIAVNPANETDRFDYVLRATYTLTDSETGARRRQSLSSTIGYGVVGSQYASLIAEEDAIRRAAKELARKIEIDIALYLKGRPPAASRVDIPDVMRDDFRERAEEAEKATRTE